MNGKDMLDMLEHIDPALVEEADTEPIRSRFAWPVWIAGAACLALLFLGLWVWNQREPGYAVGDPTETTQTEPTTIEGSTELYFNEGSVAQIMVSWAPSFWERYPVALSARQVAMLVPEDLPDWAAFRGELTCSGEGQPLSVTLEIPETSWGKPIYLEIQDSPFDWEYREDVIEDGRDTIFKLFVTGKFRSVPVYPGVTDVHGLICTAYICSGNGLDGGKELIVEFQMGELYYCLHTITTGTAYMAPETARQNAKDGLWELMTCFARMEQEQTLYNLTDLTSKKLNQENVQLLWNEPTPVVIYADEVFPYFSASPVPLTPEQLLQCIPDTTASWMEFTGSTLYLWDEYVHSVCLTLPTSQGNHSFTIFIQESPESLAWDKDTLNARFSLTRFPANGIYEPYKTDNLRLTVVDGQSVAVYRQNNQQTGITRLWAEFYRNGLRYSLFLEIPEKELEQAEKDFRELLVCYVRNETIPDLSTFPRGQEGTVEPVGGGAG